MQPSIRNFLSIILILPFTFYCASPNNGVVQEKDLCEAIGTAYKFSFGPCEEPCNPQILEAMHIEARGKALGDATINCLEANGPDASCEDGEYTLLLEECETITTNDSIEFKFCNMTVIYEYKGKCKKAN